MTRRDRSKELKVRLPLEQHVQLHTLKVMHGQPIQVTVRDALAAYFRDFEAGHDPAAGGTSAPAKAREEPSTGG